MSTVITFPDLRIDGVAAVNALAGATVPVLVRAEMTSDDPEFQTYLHNLTRLLVGKAREAGSLILMDRVSIFLLVTHRGGRAELYLQDFATELQILAKRRIGPGEPVFQNGIADIARMRMPWLTLGAGDGVLMCFKVGWKFGLFFDLSPDSTIDSDEMERSLGRIYRRLSFQAVYDALGDDLVFAPLMSAGWFPFVELLGGEFEALLSAYTSNFNVEGEEMQLLGRFDAARIDDIGRRWWERPSLKDRRLILQPALDAFKRGDPVSCLKIVLTEIEGILQDSHIATIGHGAAVKELLTYAIDNAIRKTGDGTSLLFPKYFLRYLRDCTYAQFDAKNPSADIMSRHSAGHGGATASAYTQMRALQALLTLDQVSIYLP